MRSIMGVFSLAHLPASGHHEPMTTSTSPSSIPRSSPGGALALWSAVVLLPAVGMGYLRDDWLLLWSALSPETAPEGATGVFPRPLAAAQWKMAVALGGDAPWAMHLLAGVGWAVLLAGAWIWLGQRRAVPPGARALGLAWFVGHGALVEPRLWAAAANGVWAAALAVLVVSMGPLHRRKWLLALLLWTGALFHRVDALALAVLPLVPMLSGATGRRRTLVALSLAGGGALGLAWMISRGGGWSFDLMDAGRALRLVLLPYGPVAPPWARQALGGVALAGLLLLSCQLVLRGPKPGRRGDGEGWLVWVAGSIVLAQGLVDWAVAGRYLLVPLLLGALVLAIQLSRHPRWRGVVLVYLMVELVAVYFGHSSSELRSVAQAETSLYRQARAMAPAESLGIIDPPRMGWQSSAADLENIVSTAWGREVGVRLDPGDEAFPWPRLRWEGAVRRWTGPAEQPESTNLNP